MKKAMFAVGAACFCLVGTALVSGCDPGPPANEAQNTDASSSPSASPSKPSYVTANGNVMVTPAPAPRHTEVPSGKPHMPEAVKRYMLTVSGISGDMVTSLTSLTDVSTEAGDKPSLIVDNDWKLKAAAACAGMIVTGQRLQEIKPVPKECRNLQKKLSHIGEQCEFIAHKYIYGVDHIDADSMQEANNTMSEVAPEAQSLVADVNEVKSHYSDSDN